MKLAEIVVGDEYAIRWGGTVHRGLVTFAGTGRQHWIAGDGRQPAYSSTGARVFYTRPGLSPNEYDVAPASVLHPWHVEQAKLDQAASRQARIDARLTAIRAAVAEASGLDDPVVRWDFLSGQRRYSDTHVVVRITDLAKALGVELPFPEDGTPWTS